MRPNKKDLPNFPFCSEAGPIPGALLDREKTRVSGKSIAPHRSMGNFAQRETPATAGKEQSR